MRRVRAWTLTLALLGGCSGADPVPEEGTPIQDQAAPSPREPAAGVPLDAPPLGSTRPKVAPASVVEEPGPRPN